VTGEEGHFTGLHPEAQVAKGISALRIAFRDVLEADHPELDKISLDLEIGIPIGIEAVAFTSPVLSTSSKAISVKEYKCSLVFSPVFCVAPTVT
jgi:hypothetical protein